MNSDNRDIVLTFEDFRKFFCSAYIKTLHPSEKPLYSKQIITWRKMKRIVLKGEKEELTRNPTCHRLYQSFFKNMRLVIDNRYKTPIEYLMLPTSINNSLRRQKIYYIEDLANDYQSSKKLCSIRKIGKNFSDAILEALKEWNTHKKTMIDQSVLNQEKDFLCFWEKHFENIQLYQRAE